MAQLTEEHISYITKDLSYRGLVDEGIREELIDHVCSAVEEEMDRGKRFFDAYRDVLRLFGHTSGIRKLQNEVIETKTKARGMLKSYLLIAMRNHIKNKFHTIINVAGLAVGIGACLTIMLYVVNELSYDRWNEKAGRILRVDTELRVGSVYHRLALSAASLTERWANYPEIESSVRILNRGWFSARREDAVEPIYENVVWADSTFFSIFSVPLIEGDIRTALAEPNTVAISRKMAEKYFPEGNALNKSLLIGSEDYQGEDNCRVTAIFENIPDNSHFHFDMIRPMVSTKAIQNTSLVGGGELSIYLLLREGMDPAQLEAKFPAFIEEHVAPQLAAALQNDFSMKKFEAEGNIWHYSLTPLTDIHLHSDLEGELEANGSIVYVYLFSSIAVLILIIACINFMNLSTARSANRAREVGIRKVMGSLRSHLVRQFLIESFLLSLAAFVLAVGIAYLFLPLFNQLAQKNLTLPFGDFTFYLTLIAAAFLVGMMAGIYPSFFLARFKPVIVLKGSFTTGQSGLIRGGLVVFQFVISIFLIVGTIAVGRQLSYIQNKKIGFNKDQVLVVHQAGSLGNQLQSFKEEVLRNSIVTDGTISGYLPVTGTWRNSNTWWPQGKAPTGQDVANMISMQIWDVDYDYLKTLGMSLKDGRNFSRDFPADSGQRVILNQAAVKAFDFGDDPIGKEISCFGGENPDGTPDLNSVRSWRVIGVVEDFHFESMRNTIAPVGLFLRPSTGYACFRFTGADVQQVLAAVEKTWNKLAPGKTFTYSFLDEDFGKMYDSEKRLGTIFAIFATLAILIACLGLFALTSFTVQQRTREIGIRKTMGASIESIVLLLSKSYGKLVLIAFVVATPIAWYAVNWWLESYSYKASMGIMVYVLSGIAAFLIAMITIGYRCIRAATANPATALRSE